MKASLESAPNWLFLFEAFGSRRMAPWDCENAVVHFLLNKEKNQSEDEDF